MKPTLTALSIVALTTSLQAASVTGWVSIFDPQDNDPRFSAGTEATDSPITTDADQDSIAANFATTTLSDGDFITVSGTVSFDVAYDASASTQFRVGLFDGGTVSQNDGNPYIGIYSEAPTTGGSNLKYGPGTHASHPFGSGTTIATSILPAGGTVAANIPIHFSLTIARDGANLDVATSYTDNGSYGTSGSVDDLDILSTADSYNYTYNTVAFLMGGALDGGQASFSNIDVTTGTVPEPSVGLLGLLGALGLLLRRRA